MIIIFCGLPFVVVIIYKCVYGYDLQIEILMMTENFNIQDLANTAKLAVYHLSLLKVDWLIEIIMFLLKTEQKQPNYSSWEHRKF